MSPVICQYLALKQENVCRCQRKSQTVSKKHRQKSRYFACDYLTNRISVRFAERSPDTRKICSNRNGYKYCRHSVAVSTTLTAPN